MEGQTEEYPNFTYRTSVEKNSLSVFIEALVSQISASTFC
jgi:hypothetical protein